MKLSDISAGKSINSVTRVAGVARRGDGIVYVRLCVCVCVCVCGVWAMPYFACRAGYPVGHPRYK